MKNIKNGISFHFGRWIPSGTFAADTNFPYLFPAYSVTVLRIGVIN
jgi:hypothetical protein